ncbi:alpha/beta hydrolase [Legionella busanensis]|uniref:Alpha/beta hydrolase n=1 Tax=Legionella busanensis TaxID=190655 RepID=A0A378JP50_9GAMM|nr:alpha/beta hydrolase [Legionella busanensis]STX52063.1 alpha/beta hydrolase [Legionella busanensis]
MKKSKEPVWMKKGPAQHFYQHLLKNKSIVQQWLTILRSAWGDPGHPDLEKYLDVSYKKQVIKSKDNLDIPISLFIPKQLDSSAVFIYIHGGGWIAPTAGKHQAWAKKIAHLSKIKVISIDYRLAPEHPYPAALEDCVTVYEYIRANSKAKVFIGGDSAGGNLAAAVALYCADHAIAIPDKILCLCPLMDFHFENYPSIFELGIGNPRGDSSLLAFERFCYVPDKKDWKIPYVSPMYGQLQNLPETLILIAEDDPLRDDNIAFVEKLKAANVKVTILSYKDMPHTFYTYPQFLPKQAQSANEAISQFIIK